MALAEERRRRGLPSVNPDDDALVRRLQQQVDELKWHLRDATEQGTARAQELKASNEELQAINEELRTATEELETSREELQSINEELTTVNHELKVKVDELSRANGDLQNLMAATAIATVFLDRSLCISLFTPSAVELFNLIDADVGRPISDLANRLDYPPAQRADARRAGQDVGADRARGGASRRSAGCSPACCPYRSGDDRISGVVLTFVDISERRRVGDALRESEALFRTIVAAAAAGVAHIDLEGRIMLVNARFALIAGRTAETLVGASVFELVHADDRARNVEGFRRLAIDATPFEMEMRYLRGDGVVVWVSSAVTAVLGEGGRPDAAVAIVLDVSDRRGTEQALRESEERLRLIVDNAREYAIVTMDLKRRITGWNIGAEGLAGFVADEVIGGSADLIFIEEDRVAGVPQREAATALAEGRAADERWHRRKNGTRFWGSGVMATAKRRRATHLIGDLLKIFRDQTAQARAAEQALETSRAESAGCRRSSTTARRAEAEAAGALKDRFLAILSHELRIRHDAPVVGAACARAQRRAAGVCCAARSELLRRNGQGRADADRRPARRHAGVERQARDQRTKRSTCTRWIHAAADVCAGDFAAKRQRLGLAPHGSDTPSRATRRGCSRSF